MLNEPRMDCISKIRYEDEVGDRDRERALAQLIICWISTITKLSLYIDEPKKLKNLVATLRSA